MYLFDFDKTKYFSHFEQIYIHKCIHTRANPVTQEKSVLKRTRVYETHVEGGLFSTQRSYSS